MLLGAMVTLVLCWAGEGCCRVCPPPAAPSRSQRCPGAMSRDMALSCPLSSTRERISAASSPPGCRTEYLEN